MKINSYLYKGFAFLVFILFTRNTFAQNVGISSVSSFTPDASAALDVSYTSKGLLIPRVALTATNATGPISSPATSLLVYNTATAGASPYNVIPGYYYYNGSAWVMLTTSAQAAGFWSIIGNSGTSYPTNFLGTTDNYGLHFKTNGTHRLWLDSLGSVAVGLSPTFSSTREKFLVDAGTTTSFNVISGKGNLNNYLQLNIQNLNAGTAASSDVVATADNGTESINYVDMGTNSSANTANYFGGANDSYLYSAGGSSSSTAGGNLYIGTSTTGKNLGLLTGGSTIGTSTAANNERLHIDGTTGYIGLGNIAPTQVLDITGNLKFSGSLMPNNDPGTAGYFLVSTGAGNTPIWFNASTYAWLATGNTGTTAGTNFIGTTDAKDFVVKTNNTEITRFTSGGNVGIGTTTPSTKLHVFGANPLTLSGVVTGTNTTADSLLTITSGLVRKLPLSTFAPTGSWSTTGNAGTTYATNFLGTTDNNGLHFRTNSIQRAVIDSLGNMGVGSANFNSSNPEKLLVDASTTSSTNVISGKGTINSFLQLNIQNLSSGNNASSDVVASADNGTDAVNYVDMGINSSGNKGTFNFGAANDAYLYNAGGSVGGNFYIGTSTSAKILGFLTGGTAASNERMRIDGTGNVGIGTTAPAYKLDVSGSINASTSLISQGSIFPDYAVSNTGVLSPGIILGGSTSGEGISSKRTSGTNQYGIDFYTSSNNRMTIMNGGNIGIGTTTPGYKLTVAGVVAPTIDNTYSLGGGTSNRWTTVYATNGVVQSSDRRLKTNIKDLNYGLKEVLALQPVSYNWKEKPNSDPRIGLIAQDVRKLVPEVVTGDEAKEKLGMNYAELVPVLINAIKQQQKQIDDLKKKVQKLQK
ncbi:MAG: tail fiber domain-containing protein [Janthinobacterium lividum]